MVSVLPFPRQYLQRPPLLCIALASYDWGIFSYSLHSLGLPLWLFLFFNPVTLLFKSPSGPSYSFPWPTLHVPFALEFSKFFHSYMQSQFYVSGSVKGPLPS